MNTFNRKHIDQLRMIRHYAKANHLNLDAAAQRWVDTGCAARVAKQYCGS